MGDKTQLLAMAMASKYKVKQVMLGVLVATILNRYIKWGAGIIFMFFGTLSLYNSVPVAIINLATIALYVLVIGGLTYLFGVKLAYQEQSCKIILKKEDIAADINTER